MIEWYWTLIAFSAGFYTCKVFADIELARTHRNHLEFARSLVDENARLYASKKGSDGTP